MIYEKFLDYEAFEKKFERKKTTDECLTPNAVYEVVLGWATAHYRIEGRPVVRPFWPRSNYRTFDYPDGCVVVDNPPFSIMAEIVDFYSLHKVDFFLFAPHLTNFTARANHVLCGSDIVYGNGAGINTSFVTSLGADKIANAPDLYEALDALRPKREKGGLPQFDWPEQLIRTTDIDSLTKNGIPFTLSPTECTPVHKVGGKAIFGGGYLMTSKKACEKAAAKKEAKKKAARALGLDDDIRQKIVLAPAELEAVRLLDKANGDE